MTSSPARQSTMPRHVLGHGLLSHTTALRLFLLLIVCVSTTLLACSKQGEGERCDVENNSDDCQAGLRCERPGGQTSGPGVCTSSTLNPNGGTSTDAATDTTADDGGDAPTETSAEAGADVEDGAAPDADLEAGDAHANDADSGSGDAGDQAADTLDAATSDVDGTGG